jgi:serine/threonine protein kinase
MAVNICPQCKSPNRVSARFCSECGEPLLGGVSGATPQPAAPDDETTISAPISATQANYQAEVILQGRYRLESELGRGGFGAVYKAWDINVSRPCAVKENLDTSIEAARQFGREASVLANLSHPNLPRVTDHFSIPGKGQYLVMDFVDGEDLASILERQASVPYLQAVDWIVQVAEALEYLHDQEPPVLHRDIKPANIRITRKSRAVLVDFGLVKLYDPKMQTTLGARAVTPGYAPPEQYGKGKTDARTDIYALGATLYHLTTGVEPLESVQRVSGERMQSPQQVNPLIPLSLSQAIERSLALDPAQRFQNMVEFRSALAASLGPQAEAIRPDHSEAAHAPSSSDEVTMVDHPPVSKPLPVASQPPVQAAQPGAARPASQPQARPPSQPPVQAAHQPGAARPASQPQARPPSQPPVRSASRPASQPRPATRKQWLPVTTIIAVIVLCMVAALVVGGLLLNSGPTAADITATVQTQRTLSAGLQATSTAIYELQATKTAAAKPAP